MTAFGVQVVPSGNEIVKLLFSVSEDGKLVPMMVRLFPPWLLRPIVGLTDETVKGMSS